MTHWVWLERAAYVLVPFFLARVWGKWRAAKREQAALTTPLVDAALLEATFAPRPRDGDDPDLLAEMRDTLAHLNRQAYAEEFWGLNAQLSALEKTLLPPQKATLRRAVLRLLVANDRWLQMVGAKTAVDLRLAEAVPPLTALLEMDRSEDARFRAVLEDSLLSLSAPLSTPALPE